MSNSEKYRNPYETDREWKLKELFIEKYKDQFEENRLVCLAQCYVNVETMGCRYPNELMEQLKDLTKDFKPLIGESHNPSSYDEKNNKKQQYTQIKFVPSSTNPPKTTTTTIKFQQQQQQINVEKHTVIKQVNKNSPPQPQIQILKNPNKQVNESAKFQTITQLNQSKSVKTTKSPPKTTANTSSSLNVKSSPPVNQNNFNNGTNIPLTTTKNAWNSPNQRTRLDFNNTTNMLNSTQKPRNQTPNIGTGTGVPSSTMEQSPAPGLVPIPFGLSTPTFQDCSLIPTASSLEQAKPKSTPNSLQTRNALLNSLFSSNEASHSIQQQLDFSENSQKPKTTQPNPLSILIQGMANKHQQQPVVDSQFQKLSKISKLREILRSDPQIKAYIESRNANKNFNMQNKEQDIIDHFKKVCSTNDIKLDYSQFLMPEGFYGEIYLENFRLIKEQDKKRKRCCYFAHRNALLLLFGQSELAVRIAPSIKRDNCITLDNRENETSANTEIKFEYELYLVDSNDFLEHSNQKSNTCQSTIDMKTDTSCQNIANGKSLCDLQLSNSQVEQSAPVKFEFSRQTSLPCDISSEKFNPATDKESIFLLNSMLKSLILPQPANTQCDEILEEDMNDDDDADVTMSLDRKKRIKEAIGSSFCLFIPDSMLNAVTGEVDVIHERNAIQILNNSCQKCGFILEFELKLKSSSNKRVISADQIQSDSEEGDSESENVKRKYKCKCLINRVKISSSHAKTKIDSKRQVALKSLNYLTKIFPIIKESSYASTEQAYYHPHTGEFHQSETSQSLPVQSTTGASHQSNQARYFKISKEDLFKGLVPPTLFETSKLTVNAETSHTPMINSKLGLKLLTKMGWKGAGHGLGKDQQGITQPIEVDQIRQRSGIGCRHNYDDYLREIEEEMETETLQNDQPRGTAAANHKRPVVGLKRYKQDFRTNIQKLLKNFISSVNEEDLVFEKGLTNEERAMVHKEAARYGLKTRSHGNGENRFLVAQKRRTAGELMDTIIKKGGQFSKYELVSKGDMK